MISIDALYSFLDRRIVDVLKEKGFSNLYDWQLRAIKKGLDGRNIVMVAPTGAGKSLPAEVLGVNDILLSKKKLVYVAPLRSLAREKFNDFKKWYKIGLRPGLAMGEYWAGGSLNGKDIIVTTYPKMLSLIGHGSSFIKDIGVIIIDEFHTMSYEVEFLVSFAKLHGIRVIALSATVGNLDELAKWMDATVVRAYERPITIRGGVVLKGNILWVHGEREYIGSSWYDVVRKFVLDGMSVIVFVWGRRKAENFAKKIGASLFDYNADIDDEDLLDLDFMRDMVVHGVAYHHAGLKNKERNKIENLFREGKLKVIVATRTLALGVNLPADVVIVKDVVRPGEKQIIEWLDAMDVWQMLGRAGRRGKSKVGIGLIYSSKLSTARRIIDRYFEGKIEKSQSKIMNELERIIIEFLGYERTTLDKLYDFILGLYGTSIMENLAFVAVKIIESLAERGFVQIEGNFVSLTKFGKLVATLFISPRTAEKMLRFSSENIIDILWFLSGLDEFDVPNLAEKGYDNFSSIFFEGKKMTEKEKNRAKVLDLVLQWINGDEIEDIIKRTKKVGYGDMRLILENFEWLSFALSKVKKFVGNDAKVYGDLIYMIKYGVTEDLVPYVKIRGVGRKRAIQMAQHRKENKIRDAQLQKNTLAYWVGGDA